MYARTVAIDLNPEMWDEALEFGNSVKHQIAAFPGLRSWVLSADRQTGKATSFSVFDDEAAFLKVNDQINQILSEFRRFFVAPPTETLGDVLVRINQ